MEKVIPWQLCRIIVPLKFHNKEIGCIYDDLRESPFFCTVFLRPVDLILIFNYSGPFNYLSGNLRPTSGHIQTLITTELEGKTGKQNNCKKYSKGDFVTTFYIWTLRSLLLQKGCALLKQKKIMTTSCQAMITHQLEFMKHFTVSLYA